MNFQFHQPEAINALRLKEIGAQAAQIQQAYMARIKIHTLSREQLAILGISTSFLNSDIPQERKFSRTILDAIIKEQSRRYQQERSNLQKKYDQEARKRQQKYQEEDRLRRQKRQAENRQSRKDSLKKLANKQANQTQQELHGLSVYSSLSWRSLVKCLLGAFSWRNTKDHKKLTESQSNETKIGPKTIQQETQKSDSQTQPLISSNPVQYRKSN